MGNGHFTLIQNVEIEYAKYSLDHDGRLAPLRQDELGWLRVNVNPRIAFNMTQSPCPHPQTLSRMATGDSRSHPLSLSRKARGASRKAARARRTTRTRLRTSRTDGTRKP